MIEHRCSAALFHYWNVPSFIWGFELVKGRAAALLKRASFM